MTWERNDIEEERKRNEERIVKFREEYRRRYAIKERIEEELRRKEQEIRERNEREARKKFQRDLFRCVWRARYKHVKKLAKKEQRRLRRLREERRWLEERQEEEAQSKMLQLMYPSENYMYKATTPKRSNTTKDVREAREQTRREKRREKDSSYHHSWTRYEEVAMYRVTKLF